MNQKSLRRLASLGAIAGALTGCAMAGGGPPLMPYPSGARLGTADSLRYDQLVTIACHNCYAPSAPGITHFTDALRYTTDLEVDIHARPRAPGDSTSPPAWDVRHGPGETNNCAGTTRRWWQLHRRGTGTADLRQCLSAVAAWIDAHPTSPVLTLFVDLKDDGWDAGHTQADLDALLVSVFGARLYRPADLSAGAGVARAAGNHAWRSLRGLRGMALVVLTGGEEPVAGCGYGMRKLRRACQLVRGKLDRLEAGRNTVLAQYVKARGDDAAAFVAPSVRSPEQVLGPVAAASGRQRRAPKVAAPLDFEGLGEQVAFYNFYPEAAIVMGKLSLLDGMGAAARKRGVVVRLWVEPEYREESRPTFCAAARAGIQRVASHYFRTERICLPGQ